VPGENNPWRRGVTHVWCRSGVGGASVKGRPGRGKKEALGQRQGVGRGEKAFLVDRLGG